MGAGTSGVALILNMESFCLNLSGLTTGPLLKSFSPRAITIAGSTCVGLGLILCGFADQLWHFLITYSLFVGFGLGIIAPASFLAINQNFTTKKGRAVGWSMAGTGVGQMVLPYVVTFLLLNFGFSTAVMTMGALAFIGVLGGCLFKPLAPHQKQVEKIQTKKVRKNFFARFFRQIAEKLDLKLLKDPKFLSLTIGCGLSYTASVNFAMIFPIYLQVSNG